METLKTSKKKNNRQRLQSLPPLRFKKFQMNLDQSGVHILLSANFLKKNNHTLRVRDGQLNLKIKQPPALFGYANGSKVLDGPTKDIDFQIRLPHKQYRHIKSARFLNGSLKIHLVESYTTGATLKYAESAAKYHGVATSYPS
ncbi:hypothetical protein EHW67_06425 [Arenibacter aquaticus]|uniref:Uncharacterized protein n=1 Tax=Arenibacter aquaticus TaxID=2489054 RepID=A0A430K700_9FLAO|nr:hypothetical protein [Arenibacter aquaticus]RTE54797.1 hypothetical protein EHW67_06425 [Arenibacter aquaticus]